MYVYIQGGLTNSLKQIYGSASSVVALLDGNKGSGSNEGDEEPSVTPADHETGNKLADALSEAISNGYSEGSGKKFPYISFFGGLSQSEQQQLGGSGCDKKSGWDIFCIQQRQLQWIWSRGAT